MFTACGVPHSGAQEAILLRRLRVVDPSIVSLEVRGVDRHHSPRDSGVAPLGQLT